MRFCPHVIIAKLNQTLLRCVEAAEKPRQRMDVLLS